MVAIVAVLILSVAQLGFNASDVSRSFSHGAHEGQEIASSLSGSIVSEASNLAEEQEVERILPRSLWAASLQLVVNRDGILCR